MGTLPKDRNTLVVTKRFHVDRQPDGDVVADDLKLVVVGRQDDGGPRADATVGKEGIAIAGNFSSATAGVYGIAIAGKAGTAVCGPSGAAIAHDNSKAIAADGSIAFVRAYNGHATAALGGMAVCSHNGIAEADRTGYASVESGKSVAGDWGIASVREEAEVKAGAGGIAVAWNRVRTVIPPPTTGGAAIIIISDRAANSDLLKSISAGEGGLIISFYMDDHGRRQPVVGFVGDIDIKAQGGLKPGQAYRLAKDGQFVPT